MAQPRCLGPWAEGSGVSRGGNGSTSHSCTHVPMTQDHGCTCPLKCTGRAEPPGAEQRHWALRLTAPAGRAERKAHALGPPPKGNEAWDVQSHRRGMEGKKPDTAVRSRTPTRSAVGGRAAPGPHRGRHKARCVTSRCAARRPRACLSACHVTEPCVRAPVPHGVLDCDNAGLWLRKNLSLHVETNMCAPTGRTEQVSP